MILQIPLWLQPLIKGKSECVWKPNYHQKSSTMQFFPAMFYFERNKINNGHIIISKYCVLHSIGNRPNTYSSPQLRLQKMCSARCGQTNQVDIQTLVILSRTVHFTLTSQDALGSVKQMTWLTQHIIVDRLNTYYTRYLIFNPPFDELEHLVVMLCSNHHSFYDCFPIFTENFPWRHTLP